MANETPDYAILVVSPGTLNDLTVTCNWSGPSSGLTTYTLADAITDHASYPGYLVIGLTMGTI